MRSAPLPGPMGLYTVSVLPRFLQDSSRVGWAGAFYTDIQAAPEGQVDHAHTRLCVRRNLQPEMHWLHGATGWQSTQPHVRVLHPADEERVRWRQGGRAQFLFVAPELAGAVLGRWPQRGGLRGPLHGGAERFVGLLLDALAADLAQGSPAGPLVGEQLIAALLAHLACAGPAGAAALARPGRARVTELLDARFAEPLSLDELAAASGLGVRQFTRAFRAATGQSPHQYLLQRRVEHAQLLIRRGLPLAEVAAQCGFADQSQLNRCFTRRVGLSPGHWRRQHGR